MKNLFIIFISVLLLQLTSLAQEGWIQQISGTTEHFKSVHFVDSNTGWAVGWGGIFNTTDGGENWNVQYTGECYDVFFIDNNTGWVTNGAVLKTTNGGIDWIAKPSLCVELGRVFFIDENIGWVIGLGGFNCNDIIQKSTDGGESWTELSVRTGSALWFIDSDVGWYVYYGTDFGEAGVIYKTTNGGLTFIPQDTSYQLTDVCFTDDNNGWVTSRGGNILYTTNGGEDWNEQVSGGAASVHFVDSNTGWAVGGTILHTTNGGEDWNQQVYGITLGLNSVHFIDSNTGWAVGANGTILKTTNGGVSLVEEEEIDEIPTDYSLSNNFPNPFNPSTKIRYSVPQTSNVMIKVFDILGKEIETLVNEEKPIGTYEITWSAGNLPSGIYFYRLQAGSFVETKKMVLMK